MYEARIINKVEKVQSIVNNIRIQRIFKESYCISSSPIINTDYSDLKIKYFDLFFSANDMKGSFCIKINNYDTN